MGQYTQAGFRLLIVDDSAEDLYLVRRALEKSGVGLFFQGVSEVAEAINYVRGEGQFADREKFPFPNAVVSDLKMPGMDGFDFLRWLRNHPQCRVIPVIIFSSSYIESDVQKAYALGCNAFLAKPSAFDELVELIRVTFQFWSRCQVPPPPPGGRCS